MEYPGPERDAQFKSKTQSEKSFSLLSPFFASLAQSFKKTLARDLKMLFFN
jgi:hypothetical protein